MEVWDFTLLMQHLEDDHEVPTVTVESLDTGELRALHERLHLRG